HDARVAPQARQRRSLKAMGSDQARGKKERLTLSGQFAQSFARTDARAKSAIKSRTGQFRLDRAARRAAKVEEELGETKSAIASQDRPGIEDEIGDLLFAVVNLARKCKLDAESAL